MRTVAFPGLGLEFALDRVAFHLGSFPVYWYGVIIATGFLLAVLYCTAKAPKLGIRQDDFIDVLFWAAPLGIVGARLYYVIFYLDLFRDEAGNLDFAQMIDIRDGGMAIYGSVIAAFITVYFFCKVKKISFPAMMDVGVFGLLIGQLVGRWGNFVNIEAYGGPTDLPWRMGIEGYVDGVWQYMEVHPTFLYESLWNLLGFGVLVAVSHCWRKFDGQMALLYLAWYGVGRGIIEGLRTDSLYLFQTGIRVSQMVGFVTAVVSIALIAYVLLVKKPTPEGLNVNQVDPESLKSDSSRQKTKNEAKKAEPNEKTKED